MAIGCKIILLSILQTENMQTGVGFSLKVDLDRARTRGDHPQTSFFFFDSKVLSQDRSGHGTTDYRKNVGNILRK